MVQAKPFGRRINPQQQVARPVETVEVPVRPTIKTGPADFAARPVSVDRPETKLVTHRDDFEERKHGFAIPWRPLALMASLCFGIASFVLPDTVNDTVQWLLYGLMAMSLYAGFSRRRTGATG